MAFTATVTLTRTNDTNPYGADDVVGAATGSTAALEFPSMATRSGKVRIVKTELLINASALIASEGAYRLHLYNVTPPSVYGDNVAWDILTGDRASYMGYIDLGTPVDLGGTLYISAEPSLDLQMPHMSTSVFAYLTTRAAYTPTASRVHVITLHGAPY